MINSLNYNSRIHKISQEENRQSFNSDLLPKSACALLPLEYFICTILRLAPGSCAYGHFAGSERGTVTQQATGSMHGWPQHSVASQHQFQSEA